MYYSNASLNNIIDEKKKKQQQQRYGYNNIHVTKFEDNKYNIDTNNMESIR